MFVLKRNSELCRCLRSFNNKAKLKVVPDENVVNNLNNSVYRPKNHPGIFKSGTIALPESFIKAVTNVLEDHPLKSLIEDGKALINHLRVKRAPVEQDELKQIKQNAYEKAVTHLKTPDIKTEDDRLKFQQRIDNKVRDVLRKEVYNWKQVNYDTYNSLVYLISRSAAEYSVLTKIFYEISERDPNFKPRSLFDFGSGVGTVTWAAILYWKKHIFEYFNVDSSSDMNDLALLLLQDGRGTNKSSLKGVFYRQFLPSSNIAYDLVVSAYTLLELPSRQTRLDIALNLWNKTQNYLIFVEQGSNAGFQVINEVRDFILHLKSDTIEAHVFSPCPHDLVCPRFTLSDGTPCNFESFYFDVLSGKAALRKQERYCYVVLKKGKRSPTDLQWPRVVRPTLVRPRHTICRMCTKSGTLEEVIFTAAKHSKNVYHCARATKWGDLIPVALEEPNNEPPESADNEEH